MREQGLQTRLAREHAVDSLCVQKLRIPGKLQLVSESLLADQPELLVMVNRTGPRSHTRGRAQFDAVAQPPKAIFEMRPRRRPVAAAKERMGEIRMCVRMIRPCF